MLTQLPYGAPQNPRTPSTALRPSYRPGGKGAGDEHTQPACTTVSANRPRITRRRPAITSPPRWVAVRQVRDTSFDAGVRYLALQAARGVCTRKSGST
jgi:hypothetical protein